MAARPHGSNAASRDWSVGPHEPYWRTNTSFSPPPSRWDLQFQPEAVSFGSHDGIQLYGSSASSNSRESRSWVRGNNLTNHQFLVSDGIGPYLSSPADISPSQQWTPPAIQEIGTDDYGASGRGISLSYMKWISLCLVFYCMAYVAAHYLYFISCYLISWYIYCWSLYLFFSFPF